MYISPASLPGTVAELRSGQLDLLKYVNEICDRIEVIEPHIQALIPEPDRRSRLLKEAEALQNMYPDSNKRPPLYGVLVGVKDIFRTKGFPTRAGAQLPPELFEGPEAECVKRLREAGALILGKTVTTEFAFFAPGPTRNPYNPEHTPGGSSSGSAAAVAAGFCPLALGTQTIGSVIRPAAFCGIVGFKPSYDRIPSEGLIYFSPSLDHVGLFTQDVEGMNLAASILCYDWEPAAPGEEIAKLPVLGVPEGSYLAQASEEGLKAFEAQLKMLVKGGYEIKRVPAFENIKEINLLHRRMAFAELAQIHEEWFARYEDLYRPQTKDAILTGKEVEEEELKRARAGRLALREELEALMAEHGIDLWLSPAAVGSAPQGISATGDPIMNLPWTYAGMPTITLPAGMSESNLPLGLQFTAPFMADERLLEWAKGVEMVLRRL
ncbi:amidase [Thermanaerosceptrum fracticalcis]|uniref:Amidase n=1 Tax=Thermanaerosceptrum fracticalcis TaxID=1712410 RepID=A0A7G6E7B8_THEFR|nr:amidase [Thermanaerosceptrum fracticalcis]QNB47972.1 amidase [Thermanaerosceptrum fracticalcis]